MPVLLITVAFLASASPAAAQPVDSTARSAAPVVRQGQVVRDVRGAVLGRVEGVVLGSDGRPRQVLVRRGGVARVGSTLKSLPVGALRAESGGLSAVLTRAEVDALPDVPQ